MAPLEANPSDPRTHHGPFQGHFQDPTTEGWSRETAHGAARSSMRVHHDLTA